MRAVSNSFGLEHLEQGQIRLAQRAVLFERLARRSRFCIMQRLYPHVLIEACARRRAGRAQNHADPKSGHEFGVRYVGDDFQNGPFLRRRPLACLCRGYSLEQTRQISSAAARLQLERVRVSCKWLNI